MTQFRENIIRRRDVIKGLAAGAALAGCSPQGRSGAVQASTDTFDWTMATTWPRNAPALGMAAMRIGERITRMSGGRLRVRVFGAGDRVPGRDVFAAVSRGEVQIGHGAAYYWRNTVSAAPFFAGIPFGFTAAEMSAWLHFGGGLPLWRELYEPFDLVPFPAGNSGAQMGGWFRKPVTSLADLRGLRIRMPGLGGEVLARLGATVVELPGEGLLPALTSGALDAAEWVGPFDDLAFGLHRAAKVYHYPGWQEPGSTLECIVHAPSYRALPADLKAIVEAACAAEDGFLLAEMTARNGQALQALVQKHGVQVLPFPNDVLAAARTMTDEVLHEVAGRDALSRKIHASWRAFRDQMLPSTRVGEQAFLQARS